MKRKWTMFATENKRHPNCGTGDFFAHFGEKWWVEIHGLKDPIVEVELEESEDGEYWGWLDTGEDVPKMIQPHEGMFNMQFAYGPEAEVKHGNGKILRLNVRKK